MGGHRLPFTLFQHVPRFRHLVIAKLLLFALQKPDQTTHGQGSRGPSDHPTFHASTTLSKHPS